LLETALGATYLVMRNTPDTWSSPITFDPFGEPVPEGVARAYRSTAGDHTARRIGGVIFWSLALLILAGRIYAADLPVVQTVASYAAKVVALI
jgi:hypothetical protein